MRATFCLTSCASINNKSSEDWWNKTPADTAKYHYAVSLAKGANEQISREWAITNVNGLLADYVNSEVQKVNTAFANEAGEVALKTENVQALEAFQTLVKQESSAVLSGVTYEFHKEKDGTVYVLATLPIGSASAKVKEKLVESFKKSAASVEANNMMSEAIDKYFGKN